MRLMREKHTSTIMLLGGILVVLLAGCTSSSPDFSPTVTLTVASEDNHITATLTEIPPSSTSTRTLTATQTPTKTEIPTRTPTVTPSRTISPTPHPLTLEFIQDSVCMTGASYSHNVDHYVEEGVIYPLIGQIMDRSWWLVEAGGEESCWVSSDVALVKGDIDTLPVMTPPPIPSLTPSNTPEVRGIYYMLIAENTGGPFGCGDDLIKYFPGVWVKGGTEQDILGALNALFSNHNKYVNGLYNPMYQSDLKAKSVEVVGNDVLIQLGGTLVRPEDACESKRMHDQVWYTARQFTSVRPIIYLNKALLGDLLVVSK